MNIKAVIFGATGMIGQGVLIEALDHPQVESVLSISRKNTGVANEKFREIILDDFQDYSSIENELSGYNACFFCLGVSSAGMKGEDYHRITYDFTIKAAETLSRLNPEMTFCFISGAGTDDTLQSRMMWARVKGKTENALKEMKFSNVFLMRPAFVRPLKGVKTHYLIYKIFFPLLPLLRKIIPKYVTTTEEVGLAMINAILFGYEKQTLENRDIIDLSKKVI